jgi:hypothetical protein
MLLSNDFGLEKKIRLSKFSSENNLFYFII